MNDVIKRSPEDQAAYDESMKRVFGDAPEALACAPDATAKSPAPAVSTASFSKDDPEYSKYYGGGTLPAPTTPNQG